MAGERILIVEDERTIAELLRDYLRREGFHTRMEFDGRSALAAVKTFKPDMLILDIMLPALDGQEVCRLVRKESDIPILMLSARREDVDKILSLGLGADDYMTKPFSPGELVARVRAHLRRYSGAHEPAARGSGKGSRITYDSLSVDMDARTVRSNGKDIELSAKEFDLLVFLTRHPGQVFTREQLFTNVWGENRFGDIKTVTVHVQRIREKLGEDSSAPRHIKTIWGVGYRFDA